MLIVPIAGDKITTSEDVKMRVIEYTNFKDAGPAVYAKPKSGEIATIYFFDIASINGVKVEFDKTSKVFRALGRINRKQHIPQPDDKVTLLHDRVFIDSETLTVDVQSVKLKSKSLGINKGMFIKSTNNEAYRIAEIADIKRSLNSAEFDREEFMTVYAEYLGL